MYFLSSLHVELLWLFLHTAFIGYLHQVFSLKVVVTDSSLSFIRLRAITLSDVASTLVVSSKLCLYLCFIKLLSNCAADIWHLFSMRP